MRDGKEKKEKGRNDIIKTKRTSHCVLVTSNVCFKGVHIDAILF